MKGKKHLAGSSLNCESTSAPAQEPLLPVSQLVPNLAEIKRAEDILQPSVVVREGKKKRAPKKQLQPLAAHKRNGISRVRVAAWLSKPGVTEALPPTLGKQYRALAARNVTMSDLAREYSLSDIAMRELVEGPDGWESQIITKTLELFPGLKLHGIEPENSRDGEKAENETEFAQDSDVLKSGGVSIGGRIISRGFNEKKGQNRPLDNFERSGRIYGTESAQPDNDLSGSDLSEEDNYSEDSGDDIARSE
jgi:hypothetical protein